MDINEDIELNKHLNNYDLYNLLIKKYSKKKVDFWMYEMFKYSHPEIEEKEKRKDQHTFRQDLIERYKTCLITGCNYLVCEACHIIPHEKCDEEIKYNVNNGLLLRADFHKLFDSNNLKINPNTLQIELSDTILNDNSMNEYHKYHNKKINIHEKSIFYLNQIY
jgi:hypothetical protein